jgi:hypothetical protein
LWNTQDEVVSIGMMESPHRSGGVPPPYFWP